MVRPLMRSAHLRLLPGSDPNVKDDVLNEVFAALADPVRRSILVRLEGRELLVSEIAQNFDISLQAVSKHIQILVRAGLVRQERTGRISRCSLVAGPIYEASVWLNRYSKYWQEQIDLLAAALQDTGASGSARIAAGRPRLKSVRRSQSNTQPNRKRR
jgi:DNA-binding transcriptional ArsR family regulator